MALNEQCQRNFILNSPRWKQPEYGQLHIESSGIPRSHKDPGLGPKKANSLTETQPDQWITGITANGNGCSKAVKYFNMMTSYK